MTPETAAALAWASIALWLNIACAFFVLAVVVHAKTRALLRAALAVGNGKVRVARRRIYISRWYLLGSGLAVALGLLSAYSAAYLPSPPPDTRAVGALVRVGICAMLFSFLMTKVENLKTFRDFDQKQADRIEEMGADSNRRIRRMEEDK